MNAYQRRKAKRLIDRTDFTGFGWWDLRLWMQHHHIGARWGERYIDESGKYAVVRNTNAVGWMYYLKADL